MDQFILNLDMDHKCKKWFIHRDFIIKADIYNDGLKIYLTKNIKIKSNSKSNKISSISIQIKDPFIINQIKQNLEFILELKKEEEIMWSINIIFILFIILIKYNNVY